MQRQTGLPADFHIHTPLCQHAQGEPVDYLRAAVEKEVPAICFTDHCPDPSGYDAKCRMRPQDFKTYRSAIEALHGRQGPDVLFGIEADYYEGAETHLRPWLAEQPFDLVLGSIHYLGTWGFDNPDNLAVWSTVDVTGVWREYFRLVAEAADTHLFDVMAHLDLPKKFGHRLRDRQAKELAQPALDRIARAGMGIEINTGGLRKPVGEIYPSPLILDLARDREIPICFGSDAHAPGEVAHAFVEALHLAKDIGYSSCLRYRARRREVIPLP